MTEGYRNTGKTRLPNEIEMNTGYNEESGLICSIPAYNYIRAVISYKRKERHNAD